MATEKRLIDANALITQFDDCNFKGFVLKRLIEMQPTVDAVEVVRCKNCRWYGVDAKKGQFCKQHKSPSMWTDGITPLKPDDFCSYGERSAEK